MATLETYRKQAKLLLRWHREENYSVGEKVRKLARYATMTDRAVLDMKFTLALAQEVTALEAGYGSWAELKTAAAGAEKELPALRGAPVVRNVIPILLVRNVTASAAFFQQKLGFRIDFLHGLPPFYGAVSRDGIRLHLRFVHEPCFAKVAAQEESLICASFEVENVQGLFEEFRARGATFSQKLTKEAWGGTDFHVLDPDGNAISFVTYG